MTDEALERLRDREASCRLAGGRLPYVELADLAHILACHDAMVGALAVRDRVVATCPVNKPTFRGGPCPECHAGRGDTCARINVADWTFLQSTRTALGAPK